MAELTVDPNDPRLKRGGPDTGPVPQNPVYLVLSEEERQKGFVRPYRDTYVHSGRRPKYTTRDLTDEERERFADRYVFFEVYPESESPKSGRFWTAEELKSGCGTVTAMGRALSETYARNPKFYGATYCVGCQMHKPVAEFRWTVDDEVVGS